MGMKVLPKKASGKIDVRKIMVAMKISSCLFVGFSVAVHHAVGEEDPSPPFRFIPQTEIIPSMKLNNKPVPKIEGYTAASFPNPFTQPELCTQFPKVSHSWLCDPDKLLTVDEQAYIEARLMQLRDTTQHVCKDGKKHFYQLGAAVAKDIAVAENQTAQEAADTMARDLLLQWGIGNKACHDGLLLLYVKNKGVVTLATREGVEEEHIGSTFQKILHARVSLAYSATNSVSAALMQSIEMINAKLLSVDEGMGWIASIFLSFISIYIISIIIVYGVLSYILKKRYASYE